MRHSRSEHYLRHFAVVLAAVAAILTLPLMALTARAQTAPPAPIAAPPVTTPPVAETTAAEHFAALQADLKSLSAGDLQASFLVKGATSKLTGNELCAQGGILPKRCEPWLKARYADKTCIETGLTTRDSCVSYLSDRNNGVFPGCEGKGAEDCAAIKNLAVLSYLPDDIRKKADQAISTLFGKKKVDDLPGLLPFAGSALKDTDWWKSATAPGAETSIGVLVIDTDGDKIPDDFERIIGTDPLKKDTDGDGKSDTEELRAGTNPTGEGKLAVELTAPQKAFAFRKPFGQPRGSGTVRQDFRVKLASNGTGTSGAAGNSYTFSGRCQPNALCVLYVYSYIPTVLAINTDTNGDFTYTLDRSLTDGQHEVYVAITDETGKITDKSNPLSLFINEAQAKTEADFLRADVNVPSLTAIQSEYFTWGAIIVTLGAALAAWRIALKAKQKK